MREGVSGRYALPIDCQEETMDNADADVKKNDDQAEVAEKKTTFKTVIRRIFRQKELGIAIPLILIFIVIGIINPLFFSIDNIINMLRNSAFVFIIGVTMTYVFIGGGLDLSVGSTLALSGVISGMALLAGVPVWISVIFGLLVGTAVGFLNGMFIARFKIP